MLNEDGGVLYYSASTSQSKIESAANKQAIDIVLRYSRETDEESTDYISFMQNYGVPEYLVEEVRQRFNRI